MYSRSRVRARSAPLLLILSILVGACGGNNDLALTSKAGAQSEGSADSRSDGPFGGEPVPSGAAQCAEYEQSDANRRQVMAEHARAWNERSQGSEGIARISLAESAELSVVNEALGRDITTITVALEPFIDGTTFYARVDREPDEDWSRFVERARTLIIDDLSSRLQGDLDDSQRAAVSDARERLLDGEMPVISLSLEASGLEDSDLRRVRAYDVALGAESQVVLPFDNASLIARQQTCEMSRTAGEEGV